MDERNIALNLCFDGTNYHGWQRQDNALGIQEVLENAYSELAGKYVVLTGCSRTDAGVHARNYVANCQIELDIPFDRISLALNTLLPSDIRILRSYEVDSAFSARFSALDKTYTYRIHQGRVDDPLKTRYSYFCPGLLNVKKMQQAAEYLIGEHDFSAFMAAGGGQHTTVRNVTALDVKQQDNDISVTITATAYLYNMVRIIAGTLIYVGQDKIFYRDIPKIIESKDRSNAGKTVPAKGLTLERIRYE